jgi:type VI secretion system protein ImpK
MTPKFAQAIDPVMLHVLGLLERIGREEKPVPVDERLRIRALIDQAEALLGASEQWQLGKYALASWIDEMLVDAPWDGRDWWSNNVLEMELFSTRECYDRFYILAKEAGALANRDALEVFYICVVLGFRGLYRDPEFSQSTIQALGLPPDVESWARQAAMAVRLGQARHSPPATGPSGPASLWRWPPRCWPSCCCIKRADHPSWGFRCLLAASSRAKEMARRRAAANVSCQATDCEIQNE